MRFNVKSNAWRLIPRQLFLVAGMLLGIAPGPAGAQTPERVELQLSWIPTGQFAAYFAGVANGFYRAENIDLVIQRGSGSGDAVRRTAGGAALFGEGDISALMAGRVREGMPLRCVQSIYTQSPHSLFVLEGSGINGLKDLEGRVVGTTPGNSHQVYFPIVARAAGVDVARVRFVTVDPSAMTALLLNGQIAAAPQFSLNLYYQDQQAQRMGRRIRVLPYAEYGFRIYSICIYTREEVINGRPELVRRMVRATQRSLEWMRDNPQAAAELHHRAQPEADVTASLAEIRGVLGFVFNEDSARFGLGRFDPERLAQTWRVVAESQGLDASIDPQGFIDQRFLP